uniref:Nicastrin n=1 Tax=Amphiprion ocellaris TaxID=80972 RepID=A0AAQ6A8A8_AMPOC
MSCSPLWVNTPDRSGKRTATGPACHIRRISGCDPACLPGEGRSSFTFSASCNSVEKKIYVHLNYTVPCVRLLNATHQIGCQSSLSGDVGVLHVLESEENLDWVLSSGPNPPYMVILESSLFTRSVMMKLKNGSSRVAGIVVVAPNTNPVEGFSPHTSCPNENTGVYSESYDPTLAHCNVTVWNPLGNGLSYEEYDFPIFSLKDDNDTQVIRQCYLNHNQAVNGSSPRYPLCAMQLYSHMSAVTDTATCMRRNDINFSISPEMVCDPLGDFNVWASTRPLNNTEKGHKMWEKVVIAAARLDSRSFFFDVAPGAESGASGFITLLAAAHALRNVTQEAQPNRTIFYTFFQGVSSFHTIVLNTAHCVHAKYNSVLPLLLMFFCFADDYIVCILCIKHFNDLFQVRKLIENLQSAAAGLGFTVGEAGFSQPLPPSSFQRFLRARQIPGVVIENHQLNFTNRYYESMYDNAEYLNVSYPPNLTPEEQLKFVTDTAKALTEVATMVARALYVQAGGAENQQDNINADRQIVSQMLYGFLVRSNNSWFQQLIPSDLTSHLSKLILNYTSSEPTLLVQYLLANLTGSAINITQENCQNQREDENDKESKHMFTYMWVQGAAPPNNTKREGFCVRSTVRLSRAVSPAFELRDYTSKDYSTWTESRWKSIKGRIFLVASHELEMLTLGVGVGVLLASLLLTYIISSKADILFSSGREPT